MSLESGRKIHSRKWMELPLISTVIKTVEDIVSSQKQPIMLEKYPIFEWGPRIMVEDELENNDDEFWDNVNDDNGAEVENIALEPPHEDVHSNWFPTAKTIKVQTLTITP